MAAKKPLLHLFISPSDSFIMSIFILTFIFAALKWTSTCFKCAQHSLWAWGEKKREREKDIKESRAERDFWRK